MMSELLLYYLSEGVTRVGLGGGEVHQDIQLSGEHVLEEHCTFETEDATVTLIPNEGGETFMNGARVTEPTVVEIGTRIIFGVNHVFRFVNPKAAAQQRASNLTREDSIPLDWAAAQRETGRRGLACGRDAARHRA